jgi:hypothetical protein
MVINMSKNARNPQGQQYHKTSQPETTKKDGMDEGKPLSSGITQPHNAKKEGLGPNTKR